MKQGNFWEAAKRSGSIVVGSAVAALGLQAFLVPNHLTDGGIVGVSIVAAHLAGLPIGLFLLLLNAPFIYLGYKKLGRQFAVASIASIAFLSLMTSLIQGQYIATSEPILAAIFGGVAIGVGSGIVIRYGGTLDGTEIIAILAEKRSPFSVGELIMAMNVIILGTAGFVFG